MMLLVRLERGRRAHRAGIDGRPDAAELSQVGDQGVQLRPGAGGEQALLGVQRGLGRRDRLGHELPGGEQGRLREPSGR